MAGGTACWFEVGARDVAEGELAGALVEDYDGGVVSSSAISSVTYFTSSQLNCMKATTYSTISLDCSGT